MGDQLSVVERLRAREPSGQFQMGGGEINADGKFKVWGGEPVMRLRNPDGPQAASLIASLQEQLAGASWQGVESAPKDGSDLLLYFPLEGLNPIHPRTIIGHWHDGKGLNSPGFWVWQMRATRGYSDNFQPTHWMPLPEPPARSTLSPEPLVSDDG